MSKSCNHERVIVSTPLSPNLPFSPAVAFGPFVFCSGIVGRNRNTNEIAIGNIYQQTIQAMENLRQELEKAGTDFEHALKVTIFITDIRLFARMNEAYRTFFPSAFPARTCVEVSSLPDPEALVEIDLIAGINREER